MYGIDLFSGAGGMSLGSKLAGITTTHAVELDIHAARSYKLNHPETQIINKDIREVSFTDPLPRPLIIYGGPPCQGFSTTNQKTRTIDNPKNWLFQDYFRIIRETSPDAVIFENVKGLQDTAGGHFLEEIKSTFVKLGFYVTPMLLNAAHYGVPQHRTRIFLIGLRTGQTLHPPKPERHQHTVADALNDLPALEIGHQKDVMPYQSDPVGRYSLWCREKTGDEVTGNLVTRSNNTVIQRYQHIPQGGNWEDIPTHLLENYRDVTRAHTDIYRRLRADKPSVTITNYRKSMLIHPTQHRGLSVREAARLQSFPDHYLFSGSIGFQQQQVGNAVPPKLAKAVMECVIQRL